MHKQYYNQLPTNLTKIHKKNNNKYTLRTNKRILYQFQNQQEQ